MLKKISLVLACIVILLFIYVRWNRLDETLFFQNDMGRDFLVLYDWHRSGKPPLLGPQNSVLPFNQSAFYFYFFFPLFILLNHSLYVTNLTLSCMYIGSFLLGLYFLRKNQQHFLILTLVGLLITIHPQTILQNRYIWNPSFVPLFLTAGFFFFLKLQKQFNYTYLFLFSLSLAFAVGMSVSAIPAVLAFSVLGILLFRKTPIHILQLFSVLILSHIVVFLPFLAFEIKYKFQIISRIVSQTQLEKLPADISILEKANHLKNLLLQSLPHTFLIMLFLFSIITYLLVTKIKKDRFKDFLSNENMQAIFLFSITTLFIIIAPVALEAHYIFGSLTFLFLMIATFPRKLACFLIFGGMFFWLQPPVLAGYFSPASRSIQVLNNCFEKFCSENPEPLYVSVQSNFHNYHFGPEFRFLMKEKNCSVKNIENDADSASKMAVISDGGEYIHGKTSYDELTMFGNSEEIKVITCTSNLKIHVLKKLE